MAFGLVQSSVERSTSRHGQPQVSAQLLYRLALVLVLGIIVWKWVNFWLTQGNLETIERFRAVNTSNSSYSSNKSNSKSCLSTHAQTLGSTRLQ